MQEVEDELRTWYSVGTNADVSNMPLVNLRIKEAIERFEEEVRILGCLS